MSLLGKFPLLLGLFFDKILLRSRNDLSKGAPMNVKDIMTTKITTISPEMNAREALDLLMRIEISGLPVVDENKKLIGMFTEKGVLKTLLPGYIEKVGSFTYHENPKMIKQKVTALATMTVKEIMREDVISVDEDTALSEVARIMLVQRVRRLPVLNKNKELVGIIARVDVLKAFFTE